MALHSAWGRSHRRPLHFEALEDRRLLSITVDTLIDENNGIGVGDVSLRDAIAAATPGETIDFAPSLTNGGPATILLTHGELVVDKNLTIDGPGAELLTIDASGSDPTPAMDNGDGSRVFRIDDGQNFAKIDVSILDLTLTGGDVGLEGDSLADRSGGAISSRENLLLERMVITGNATLYNGGAIASEAGSGIGGATLHVIDSLITGNVAPASRDAIHSYGGLIVRNSQVSDNDGGGIHENSVGATQIEVTDSVIAGNFNGSGLSILGGSTSNILVARNLISENLSTSSLGGGGLFVSGTGSFQIIENIIRNNHSTATGGGIRAVMGSIPVGGDIEIDRNIIEHNSSDRNGGGVMLEAFSTASFILSNNTIHSNDAQFGGGIAVKNSGGTGEIVNSTISTNSASAYGGGVFVSATDGSTRIDNSTLAFNSAHAAGGIFVEQGQIQTNNTLIAANSGSLIKDIGGLFGTFELHFSLVGDNTGSGLTAAPSGAPDANGNLIGDPTGAGVINPRLAPLVMSGLNAATHTLLPGSPAIDAGDPGYAGPLVNDQRGAPFERIAGGHLDIGAYERQTLPVAEYFVDNVADEYDGDFTTGDLSLREAVVLANGSVDTAEMIHFSSDLAGQTIVLKQGQLDITDDLTVEGLGSNLLTLDASGNDPTPASDNGDGSRVFNIDGGNTMDRRTVTISGLTVTGGDVDEFGGAIRTIEDLTLIGVTVKDSSALAGGGIWAHSRLISALPEEQGLSVVDSLITGNLASGAAEYIDALPAMSGGGGIAAKTYLSIVNSTISGNESNSVGGGVFADVPATISFTTITGNVSNSQYFLGSGGGIAGAGPASGSAVSNSIIAGNSGLAPDWLIPAFNPGTPPVTHSLVGYADGSELSEAPLGSPDSNGNLVGGPVNGAINPLLDSLAFNGGSTMTHALLSGSPAIDAGDPDAMAGVNDVPEFDQRGYPFVRVTDGDGVNGTRVDMGAFELQQNPLPGDYNRNGVTGAADYVVWRKTLNQSVTPYTDADGSGDGSVGPEDYDIWQHDFGNAVIVPGSGGGAVAESVQVVQLSASSTRSEGTNQGKIATEPDTTKPSPDSLRHSRIFGAPPATNMTPFSGARTRLATGAAHVGKLNDKSERDGLLAVWLGLQPETKPQEPGALLSDGADDPAAETAYDVVFDAIDLAFDCLMAIK